MQYWLIFVKSSSFCLSGLIASDGLSMWPPPALGRGRLLEIGRLMDVFSASSEAPSGGGAAPRTAFRRNMYRTQCPRDEAGAPLDGLFDGRSV